MHTIKITPNLLFEYQCTSGKFIRLPNRIESKLFFARIGLLYYTARTRGEVARTVVERADLDGRRAGALAARRARRHADVIDGVGRQVDEQVRVARRRDRHVHVLAEVRVVVVQLVAVDQLVGAQLRRVPRQLDRVGRPRLALQVRRLLRYCHSTHARARMHGFISRQM